MNFCDVLFRILVPNLFYFDLGYFFKTPSSYLVNDVSHPWCVRTYLPLLLCLVGFGSLFILVGVHSFAVYRFRCLWNQVQLLSGDTTSARSASSRDPRDQKSQGVGERRQQQRNQNMCWMCGWKNGPSFSLIIDLLSFRYELIDNC